MPGQVDTTLVMLSPGEIAAREKVSKQAISKTIKKLLDAGHDLPVERDGRGRVAKVSLAHFEHFRGQFENSAKVSAGRAAREPVKDPEPPIANSISRDEAMRRQAWLKLQRDQLEHDEEVRRLLRVDRIGEGVAQAGRSIQAEINRLQNYADDLALAVSKEGTSGARMLLRKISAELGNRIADRLADIAEAAPAQDEQIEGDEVEA